jgi:hypothetical protein
MDTEQCVHWLTVFNPVINVVWYDLGSEFSLHYVVADSVERSGEI